MSVVLEVPASRLTSRVPTKRLSAASAAELAFAPVEASQALEDRDAMPATLASNAE